MSCLTRSCCHVPKHSFFLRLNKYVLTANAGGIKIRMSQMNLVTEMCCNHMGRMDLAKKMIDAAAVVGADYAKFQKWYPKKALSHEQYNAKHPNEKNAFDQPYGKHRERLELNIDQHSELKDYCREKGIGYSCSVFDAVSAKQISELAPDYMKIPSQKNLDLNIYLALQNCLPKELHISTGMTKGEEVSLLLEFLKSVIPLDRVILYVTTSSYPCKFSDLHLMNLVSLRNDYGHLVKGFGFSGHHEGIAPDIAALALGADFIERHFTLDRSWKGTDQAASLAIPGLSKLRRDLNNCEEALTYRPPGILDVEKEAFEKVKGNDAREFNARF